MCNPTSVPFRPSDEVDEDALSLEERADRHVRRVEAFSAHAALYVGVNALLVGINLLTSPGVFWAVWPILGWGVKLGAHAVAVFGVPGRADWRERTRAAFLRRHGAGPTPTDGGAGEPDAEAERLRRRVEHLEAIVTSADWDLLTDVDPDDAPQARAAALAEDTVPG
jgi:hypothetical protein